MSDGKILQRYQPYAPATPTNYPGTTPVNNQEALDSAVAMLNLANAQIYVDAAAGSDVTGTGAQLRPFQTIEAALADAVAKPVGNYTLMLATGNYGVGPIAWPVSAGKNISVEGVGLNSGISAPITYTAIGGVDEENVIFFNLGINDFTADLTAAAGKSAAITFGNCGVTITRADTLGIGAQVVRLFNCLLTGVDTSSTMLLTGCQYIGGSITVRTVNGKLLTSSTLVAGCPAFTVEAGAFAGLFASSTAYANLIVDGTLRIMGCDTENTFTISGLGTLDIDAASLKLAPVPTTATVTLLDDAQYVEFNPTAPGSWPVGTDQVAEALDYLVGLGNGDMKRNSFVFQPGGVSSGNTFATWAEVIAAIAVDAGPKTIYFDDSIVSPAVIPAGVYALEEVTFDNAKEGQDTFVEVAIGVSWTGLFAINNIQVNFLNTAVVESISGRLLQFNGSTITANGTSPIWDIVGFALIQSRFGSGINGSATAAAISIAAGQTLLYLMVNFSNVNATAIIGGVTESLTLVYGDSSPQFTAQSGFTGTLTTQLLTQAQFEGYTPTTPGDWSPAPSDVGGALDQLAANASAVVPTVFVFQDGGVASKNVYDTWAALYAVLSTVAGPKIVEIDDSVTSPCVIPAGTYDVADVTFVSKNYTFSATPILHLADLCVLDNLTHISGGLFVESQSTAPVAVFTAGVHKITIDGQASLRGILAGVPVIDVSGTAILGMSISNNSALGLKSITTSGTGQVQLLMWNTAQVVTDAVEGNGAISVSYDAGSNYSTTQTNFTGAFGSAFFDNAPQVGYSPSAAGNWLVSPTQVKAALDELSHREPSTFVYQEGGTTGKNVFATWAEVMAAISAAGEGPKTILVDSTFTSPCVVPAGSYSLIQVTFKARDNGSVLEFADNATISTNFVGVEGGLTLRSVSTVAVMEVSGFETIFVDKISEISSTIFPFFHVNGGGPTLNLIVSENSSLSNAGAAVVDVDATGVANIYSYTGSTIANGTYSGAGTITVVRDASPSRIPGTISGAQATAKQIDLGVLVNQATVIFTIQGLSGLTYSFDYTLTDGATSTVIDWTGLGLDGVILGGENYNIQYRA